jgi:hypothetical protein
MIQGFTQVNEKLSQFEKYRDSALLTFFSNNMSNPVIAKLADDLRAHKGDRETQNRILQETYAKSKEADVHLLEEQFGTQNFRRFSTADVDAAAKKQHQFTDQQMEEFIDEMSIRFAPNLAGANNEAQEIFRGEWARIFAENEAAVKHWAGKLNDIFGGVGPALDGGFKTAREDIDGWIKSLKEELADLKHLVGRPWR